MSRREEATVSVEKLITEAVVMHGVVEKLCARVEDLDEALQAESKNEQIHRRRSCRGLCGNDDEFLGRVRYRLHRRPLPE